MDFHNCLLTAAQWWDFGPRSFRPCKGEGHGVQYHPIRHQPEPGLFYLGLLQAVSTKVNHLLELTLLHEELEFFNRKKRCLEKFPMNSISWNLLCAVKSLYFPSTSSEQFFCSQRRKTSLTRDVENSQPNGWSWAEAFFWGSFSNGENQALIPLHKKDSNSLGTASLVRSEGNSISLGIGAVRKNGEPVLEVPSLEI